MMQNSLKPIAGDNVYLFTHSGKLDHLYTQVGVVWEQEGNYWYIHDKYAVPYKIKWDGESWVQCTERQKEI